MKKTSSFTYLFVGLSGLLHAGIFIGLSMYALPEAFVGSEQQTLSVQIQTPETVQQETTQKIVKASTLQQAPKPVIKKKSEPPKQLPEKQNQDTVSETADSDMTDNVDLVPVSQMKPEEKEAIKKAIAEDIAQDVDESDLFDPQEEEEVLPEEPNDEKISAAEPEPTQPEVEDASEDTESASTVRNVRDLRQSAGNQPPSYPKAARLSGKQGTAVLRYFVTDKGEIKDVQVMKSSGHKVLDTAAIAAVKTYRFMPGQAGLAVHPVKFSLVGDTENDFGRLRTRSAAN